MRSYLNIHICWSYRSQRNSGFHIEKTTTFKWKTQQVDRVSYLQLFHDHLVTGSIWNRHKQTNIFKVLTDDIDFWYYELYYITTLLSIIYWSAFQRHWSDDSISVYINCPLRLYIFKAVVFPGIVKCWHSFNSKISYERVGKGITNN